MDRFDAGDTHLIFEGISDGIDNKFGLESIFYGLGFLGYLIVLSLFIDLFFTSITSPILYSTFAPIRRRRDANGNYAALEVQFLPRALILIDEMAEALRDFSP